MLFLIPPIKRLSSKSEYVSLSYEMTVMRGKVDMIRVLILR